MTKERHNTILTITWLLVLLAMGVVWWLNGRTLDATEIVIEAPSARPACLSDAQDACLQLPIVTGVTLDNESITFPNAFVSDYHLVVMPFDREQQVLAVTWLPFVQEMVATHEAVQYWNIAALPELNIAIRALVMGGMSASIQDEPVRAQVAALFLTDQPAFMAALGIADDSLIQTLLMDRDGVVYHRESGAFTPQKGESMRAAFSQISAAHR